MALSRETESAWASQGDGGVVARTEEEMRAWEPGGNTPARCAHATAVPQPAVSRHARVGSGHRRRRRVGDKDKEDLLANSRFGHSSAWLVARSPPRSPTCSVLTVASYTPNVVKDAQVRLRLDAALPADATVY